ncbi:unnamed protein product, partial [Urochloa humidicola]
WCDLKVSRHLPLKILLTPFEVLLEETTDPAASRSRPRRRPPVAAGLADG